MSDWLVVEGDMRQTLAGLEPESVDAVICDPPYELGFMGRKWDSTGIAFDPETWKACLRVAKPGAHLAAFGGSRTWHRIAVAIEDAGWDIRDSLIWWYAQGFPKSLDVSKAIDAAVGAERETAGVRVYADGHIQRSNESIGFGGSDPADDTRSITTPATDAARKWSGWGTAIKPAFEPIILARKPLTGTVAANVQQYGTGAINVEGCRVGRAAGDRTDYGLANGAAASQGVAYGKMPDHSAYDGSAGRWPPNMLISHADECVEGGPCVEGCPAPAFGDNLRIFPGFYSPKASRAEREAGCEALPARVVDDSREEGSAGRENPRAGAGRSGEPRRNTHPTVKPIAVMRWLARLLTPPGGLILDPFAGSGTTGCAAVLEGFDFLGCELDPAHVAICNARIAHHAVKTKGSLL